MERKTRTRIIEVPKEENYICKVCGRKGNCADKPTKDVPFYWDENVGEHGKMVCICGHWLESKEELYDKLPINEILIWRYYLRIIKETFTPCNKCQEIINDYWNIGIFFDMKWYEKFIEHVSQKLCKDCIEKVNELNKSAEIILGNKDYEPPIELYRKWEIVEEPDEETKKRIEDWKKD